MSRAVQDAVGVGVNAGFLEVELLDAEVFEAPRRLNLADARDATGGARSGRVSDACLPDQPDPEDDR